MGGDTHAPLSPGCLAIIVEQESVHQASGRLPRVGATGQEMGDLFNVDLGI